jgi:serine phosphatase RsbU (regulator of sigma subunit)
MILREDHRERARAGALASAGLALAETTTLEHALSLLAATAARATGADVALVRVVESGGAFLAARAVAASPTVAAELEGSRLAAGDVPSATTEDIDEAPAPLRRVAERLGGTGVLLVPVSLGGELAATLELARSAPFDAAEVDAAVVASTQLALVLRAFGFGAGPAKQAESALLEVAGEALAVAAEGPRTAEELARVAAEASGAAAALLWEAGDDGLALAATHGIADGTADLTAAREAAERRLAESGPVAALHDDRLPPGTPVAVSLPLGRPPVGVLQLLYPEPTDPDERELAALATFGVRAALALRAGERARELADELERTRALLAVVGQATSELSLAHALETAVDRVHELLRVERLAVYLLDDRRLVPAAVRGLAGPHVRVAERLLELASGPLRGRGVVVVERSARDRRLAGVRGAATEAGIDAAVAVPLVAQEETIGLLALYPTGRVPSEDDRELLAALAAQLAVAVQNARLHEQATQLGEQRERALASEREASRRLRALYEISRSFAQSLSLEATLHAVAHTAVDVLDVDAAIVRMPDERREQLVPVAEHVADPAVADAIRALLVRPQPFGTQPIQRLFRRRLPLRIDARLAEEMGAPLLAPFIAKGWTAAIVPLSTPNEVVATLTLVSFRPGEPIDRTRVETAVTLAGQAALAVDNARLYQQQKEFADTMQRSLLPRSLPRIPGLDVGQVYESSARMEVGGDVYDFLELPDGSLAVVLGDVTGHGVEATADMAMAKFVFRSLAREHPRPSELLAAANDVICDEIAPAKFITMVSVVLDPRTGDVACAGAGHPAPRVLLPDGSVHGLDATGLVLGVEPNQEYEEVRERLPAGSAVVLYTDGVVEARRAGELYGVERLDAVLARNRERTAAELALEVVADCRAYGGGELQDDVAVVVLKRV